MRLKYVGLLVAVNVLVIGFCWLLVYSDLNMRAYDFKTHLSTRVVSVEYGVLSYRPTYQYYDNSQNKIVTTEGSWTLDYFKLASIIIAIIDVRWIYVNRQELELRD